MEIIKRKLEELKEVVSDPKAQGPEVVYQVYRGIGAKDDEMISITVMPPGKIGREYVKTHGHYHQGKGEETYLVLSGKAIFLLQKQSVGGKIDEARLVERRSGEEYVIPEGFGHCLINISGETIVVADWEASQTGHVYDEIRKKKGMAYFLLEGEGGVEAVANPNYGVLPPLKRE